MSYSSLHNHSEFSNLKLIDSINRPEKLVDYALELGLNGVALTDHDCVSGWVRIWNYYNKLSEEQRSQLKLILGNEIYLCREGLNAETHEKGEKFYHLILLAKDDIGLQQIRELSSRAWTRSYMKNIMRTPTYSSDLFDIVGANPGHIVAASACLGGVLASYFMAGEYNKIASHIEGMQNLFGLSNYFIELQPSYQQDQIDYNNYMIANYWGKLPFICTTDSHYLTASQREVHKVFLNSKSSGDREVDDFYASAYMMSADEVRSYFVAQGISDVMVDKMFHNTNYIAEQVTTYTSLERTSIIPKIKFDAPKGISSLYADMIYQNREITTNIEKMIDGSNPYDIHLLNLLVEPWQNKISRKTNETDYIKELDYECEQLMVVSENLQQPMTSYFITMAKMIDIMWTEADSIVGPARGSAGSSLINYLLGITQIDPLAQPVEMPFWRFIHGSRPGLPDIDIDTEANRRVKVFNKVQEYFQSIGGDLISVCTFGTEKTKSAINTAGRGLDIDDDVLSYITSMIPNERGNDLTLHQCYYGDEDHNPIKAFVEQMTQYPKLWETATTIEGLITRLGCHASGVIALNEKPYEFGSVMKTTSGQLVTAFDLGDCEQLGFVKYDYLTVQALDKIRVCMNWMIENEVMEWQGDLRSTYNKYIHPDVINYTDRGMWDSLYRGEIPSCFQFDTAVGGQAIKQIHPTSLAELTAGNGLMRLMANDGELPLDIYCRHKANIDQWYEEMRVAGLTDEEVEVLELYLGIVYGMAVSQECMMRMSMDPKIANFTVAEANVLRKGVAKKKADVLEQGRQMFYNKGLDAGTRMEMLDYVWNKQILAQAGYSFSDIHAVAYSYIALQEMNLCYFYPSIYWKCACLSVDAGAINEEDYYELIDTGVIDLSDEDDVRKQTKVNYGKVASALVKARKMMNIDLPDINVSRFGFTPDENRNTIVYGIRGIIRIGEQIIKDIIINRPYTSVQDFVAKMVTKDGKKLISKDKVVNLIKAGAFDQVENKPRAQILKEFILSVADQKKRLNLMNFQMLAKQGMFPDDFDYIIKVYNFTKYIRTMRYMGNYILDENGYAFYSEHYDLTKVKQITVDGQVMNVISEKYWDSIYNSVMDKPRAYIKAHHDELLTELNRRLFEEEYNKYAGDSEVLWELDSLNFFYSGHPLDNVSLPVETSRLDQLVEGESDGFWIIKGQKVPKLKLHSIMGTVLDKDKTKGLVTLQTPDGVIDLKLFKAQYARYDHTISNETDGIIEKGFFEKGTHLLVTGVKRGDVFIPKTYKTTGFDAILKIQLNDKRELDCFLRKSEE